MGCQKDAIESASLDKNLNNAIMELIIAIVKTNYYLSTSEFLMATTTVTFNK